MQSKNERRPASTNELTSWTASAPLTSIWYNAFRDNAWSSERPSVANKNLEQQKVTDFSTYLVSLATTQKNKTFTGSISMVYGSGSTVDKELGRCAKQTSALLFKENSLSLLSRAFVLTECPILWFATKLNLVIYNVGVGCQFDMPPFTAIAYAYFVG